MGSQSGPSVVWVRLPNSPRPVLLARLEAALGDILAALARGETLIEIV